MPEKFRALLPPQLKSKSWTVLTSEGNFHILLRRKSKYRDGITALIQGPKNFKAYADIPATDMTAEAAVKALYRVHDEKDAHA